MGYRLPIEYLPLILPALACTWAMVARPPSRLLLALTALAVAAEVPVALALSNAGGIECPRRCSTEQDLLQGLFFIALPLTVGCLLVAAALSAKRRRGPS